MVSTCRQGTDQVGIAMLEAALLGVVTGQLGNDAIAADAATVSRMAWT